LKHPPIETCLVAGLASPGFSFVIKEPSSETGILTKLSGVDESIPCFNLSPACRFGHDVGFVP
jgi:hypothetical protein